MVRRGLLLGEVVSKVVAAFAPMDDVLVLGNAVIDPIKMHVHGFGAALLDCVIDDARCARIVSLYWRGSLRVSEFEQCDTERRCILHLLEESAKLLASSVIFGQGEAGAVLAANWRRP